jgi:hypothetical protein
MAEDKLHTPTKNNPQIMKQYLFLVIFFVFPFFVTAQYYVLGDDPGAIRWRQINTANFQVIYPAGVEVKAQRMASILEKVYLFAGSSLRHKPSAISVILHTNTVRSNGFVAWAPSRVELFTTPHQEIYAQDWLEQLAIHEFRHVVQIDKIDAELPQIFKIIMGEQSAALTIGAYLPFWFLEGDAVTTETALSNSGRGRVAAFEMELKAQAVEKGIFTYDKAYLGSYKDNIPDYYQMGYQLVAGTRSRFGSDIWANVLHHVARNPLSVNAFSRGLKKATGQNHIGLYKTIFSDLKKSWTLQDKSLETTSFEEITKPHKGFVSYRYPYPVNDSTCFAVKYSMDDLTRFVLIGPKGVEKTLFTPGDLFEESITYGKGKVFWIESKTDIRWTHREFSQLRILNLRDGSLKEKRYKEKIYAPCLSADGAHLAAIKVNDDNSCSVVIISPVSGVIEKVVPLQDDLFIINPSWAEDNSGVYAVVLGNKGKSLAKIDLLTGSLSVLLPFSYNEIRRPVQHGDYLLYTSSIGGKDDLYGYHLNERVNYSVTSSRFGVRDAQLTPDAKYVIISNYTADGFKVVKFPLKFSATATPDLARSHPYQLADQLSAQEIGKPDFSNQDTISYPSKPYSKLGHLFNFHSWAPVHVDYDREELRPGVSFMSQNKLSTAITQLGYDYSSINKTGKYVAKFEYTGLFPVFKLNSDYGRENSYYYQINTYTNTTTHVVRKDTQRVNFSYNIMNINGIVNFPLKLSQGKMNRLVQPELQTGYRQTWQDDSNPQSNRSEFSITYRLYGHNLLKSSLRDIQPAIGQVIDIGYRHSPFGNHNSGTIWSAEGILYFPGLTRHHGIKIYGGYQQKETSGNTYSDYINYPRGYATLVNNRLSCLKSDYVLPLVYPDWSLGRWGYFKRISLRVFYDKAWATVPVYKQNSEYQLNFSSTGGELISDCNFLRLFVPAKMGVRASYAIEHKNINYEFLFSVNFGAL